MKQFIVMSAMIILGIFIAGLIFNLKDNADNLNSSVVTAIESIQAKADSASGGAFSGSAGGGE
ncbi:MAG: hypothetical protein FWG42_09890 [Clostridiales bacterium]|nr:hypothetical protein [Clostridiales bacterium]